MLKTHSFIKIQLALVRLPYPLKKSENTFKSPSIFVFITMATNKETYKLWILTQNLKKKKKKKKRANFINIQLECFFFFFFSSKIKYIYNFFKPKSQTSKDSKRIITFTKSIMFDVNIKTVSYCHWIKNASLPSLVIAYSYGLRSNDTATLELGRCHWKVEAKWHHFLSKCIWDRMVWKTMDMCI